MGRPVTPHVSDLEIERFSRRELPSDDLIRVTDHLVGCADCQKRALGDEPSPRADKRILDELLALGPHVPEEEIRAYVDRRLSARRQAEIERHLATCANCTAEIRDLEAFARGIHFASRRRAWSYAMVAAAAAVLLLGIVRNVGWRQGVAQKTLAQRDAPADQAQQPGEPPAAPKAAQSAPKPAQQGPATSAAPPQAMPTAVGAVTLALNIRPLRAVDASAPLTVIIGQGIHELVVRLTLREIDYPRYQVILRPAGGAELFNKPHLEPQNRQTASVLVVSVPAEPLSAGDYILTLRGEDRAGEVEDVSTSFFRVERK
jgi:hypothetical protein